MAPSRVDGVEQGGLRTCDRLPGNFMGRKIYSPLGGVCCIIKQHRPPMVVAVNGPASDLPWNERSENTCWLFHAQQILYAEKSWAGSY